MNDNESVSATGLREPALIKCIIDELTAVPVVSATAPLRSLEIARDCLLREWTELYWSALERPDFLDWASTFNIDFDTFSIKGDRLEVLVASGATQTVKTFRLEDNSGWWRMAPILLAISQRIDPAGFGLPYIGGKSANPMYRFPRRVVLAFYGYPEPQNTQQAQMIIDELKTSGIAAINADGNTTSAVVKERTAQLEDFRAIALVLEQVLQNNEQSSLPFFRWSIAGPPVSLTSGSLLASTEAVLNLGEAITRYGLELPANASETRKLILRLREPAWPPLPYVSEYIQTDQPIQHFQLAFGEIVDCQYIVGRLEELSLNKEPTAMVDLSELIKPDPASTLGQLIAVYTKTLLAFRSNPAFQAILERENLAARSRLLVTESGHIGTAGGNSDWITLTSQVAQHKALKVLFERLLPLAAEVGGALRSNGEVSLSQMMRYYEMSVPENVDSARVIAQWEKSLLILHPAHMDHWSLLGPPGTEAQRFTTQERQLIIDTTEAFLPPDSAPLIDYLSESVDTDLPRAALQAKADYLINQILITPRAHTLGNQLLSKFKGPYSEKALIAINRERLVLIALILSLDPNAGKQTTRLIGHALNDSFLWGESSTEVRRFIDYQPDLARVKNKTLATHLLLSSIAPEFLIRDIPESARYITSCNWVRLKQVVLYIEHLKMGLSRMIPFEQLMNLVKSPLPPFETFRAQHASALLLVDWAIARGLIQSDSDIDLSAYDARTLVKADIAFHAHTQRLDRLSRDAFHSPFPTPYTVALAELRNVFTNHAHLEDKVLVWSDGSPFAASHPPQYSLVELHMADKLKPDMTGWTSKLVQLNLQTMAAQFSALGKVSEQFQSALADRLTHLKDAHAALIKEAFCELPLQQRVDIEDSTLELFALSPVPETPAAAESQNNANPDTGPFAIIALLRDYIPRVFEIFVRHSQVQLRRDMDWTLLKPTADNAAPPSLPIDGEAYLRGTRPESPASCHARIERLDVAGAPFAQRTVATPDTFSSAKVNAIAQAAVNQLFKGREAAALERAMATVDLRDAEACHSVWMAFYKPLSLSE